MTTPTEKRILAAARRWYPLVKGYRNGFVYCYAALLEDAEVALIATLAADAAARKRRKK